MKTENRIIKKLKSEPCAIDTSIVHVKKAELIKIPSWTKEFGDIVYFARVLQDKVDMHSPAESIEAVKREYRVRYGLDVDINPSKNYPYRAKDFIFKDSQVRQGDIELTEINGNGYDNFVIYNAMQNDSQTIQRVDQVCSIFGLQRSKNGQGYTLADNRNLEDIAIIETEEFRGKRSFSEREQHQKVYFRPIIQIKQNYMRDGKAVERELLYSLVKIVYKANVN